MRVKRCLLVLGLSCALFAQVPQTQLPAPATGGPVLIPVISDPSFLTEVYDQLTGRWLNATQNAAAGLFSALLVCELSWFLVQLRLKKHTLDSALLATTGKLIGVGFFISLLTFGPLWMPEIINTFTEIGRVGSGLSSLGPSQIMQPGVNIAGNLMAQSLLAGVKGDFAGALCIVLSAVFVLGAFFMMTLQFIVAQIDIYIAIGIGGIALALGGSRWTVPYVERYFSFCVASGFKMMAMYFLIGGAQQINATWISQAKAIGGTMGSNLSGFIIAIGALLLAFVVYHCSKLVSSVLGGSPNMTGSDFTAFMIPMATAAVGAATIASGGTAGAAAAALGGAIKSSTTTSESGMAPHVSPGTGGDGGGGGESGAAPRVPAPSPVSSSNGGGGGIGGAIRGANVALSAVRSMPSTGHAGSPPPLRGIEH